MSARAALSEWKAEPVSWPQRPANTAVVNEHFRHPFAQAGGGGTLSSSDGLRFPMRGKSLTARHLSRYLLNEGVTSYTHVSDQHSTYGTQIIVSTERDATYVLPPMNGHAVLRPSAKRPSFALPTPVS